MIDNDSKELKLIYEEMSGDPQAAYGSNAASMPVAVMGTEPLVQRDVEVPEDAGEESVTYDEDADSETPLETILNNVKETIRKYEERKQQRFESELEESFLLEEPITSFLGGFASGVKAGSHGSLLKAKEALDKLNAENKKKGKKGALNIIGENDVKPIEGAFVKAIINGTVHPEVIGTITKVVDTKYEIELIGLREMTEDEKSKKLFGSYDPIIINSNYAFARRLDKGVMVSKSDVVIIDKTAFAKSKKRVVKSYSKLTRTETFEVGVGNIKWAMFNPLQEEIKEPTDKPKVGEVFNYKGVDYIAVSNGWTYPKKSDPTKPGAYVKSKDPKLELEIQNAWLSSK
jgi:hypothetical protein